MVFVVPIVTENANVRAHSERAYPVSESSASDKHDDFPHSSPVRSSYLVNLQSPFLSVGRYARVHETKGLGSRTPSVIAPEYPMNDGNELDRERQKGKDEDSGVRVPEEHLGEQVFPRERERFDLSFSIGTIKE